METCPAHPASFASYQLAVLNSLLRWTGGSFITCLDMGGSAREGGNPPAYVVPNCPPRSPMPAGRFVAVGACALHLSLSLSFIACHWYRVCVCVCVCERERERVQQLRLCARDVNAIRTPASAARFAFFIVDGAAGPCQPEAAVVASLFETLSFWITPIKNYITKK